MMAQCRRAKFRNEGPSIRQSIREEIIDFIDNVCTGGKILSEALSFPQLKFAVYEVLLKIIVEI
jgi:hypothetical protein